MNPAQSSVAWFPVLPAGQKVPHGGVTVGLVVGDCVGGDVGLGVVVGIIEMVGLIDGEFDVVGLSDEEGAADGAMATNVMGSLIRSTAHHMMPLIHCL